MQIVTKHIIKEVPLQKGELYELRSQGGGSFEFTTLKELERELLNYFYSNGSLYIDSVCFHGEHINYELEEKVVNALQLLVDEWYDSFIKEINEAEDV